jgi:hypothetical protein
MAECQCGGATVNRAAICDKWELKYQSCQGCGRVGDSRLYLNDSLIERGNAARRRMNELCEKGHATQEDGA